MPNVFLALVVPWGGRSLGRLQATAVSKAGDVPASSVECQVTGTQLLASLGYDRHDGHLGSRPIKR